MSRQDFTKRRKNNKHEFPTGLVLLGLLLVAVAWLGVLRPHILEPLSLQPASSLVQNPANTVKSREISPTPQLNPDSTRETAPAQVEATNAVSKQGDFFRYTDDQGVIHLVDNPASIPEKYRQQVKVYLDDKPATQVRVVNNQVFVPVTLRNGGRTAQATLILDTGCTVTTISEELAVRLGIDPNRTRPGTSRVADGRSVSTRQAIIDELTAGPKTKAPLEVSVMPVAGPRELADGLLGMNFLRDFRYQIDMTGQQINWR
jgi:hypothetical protein